MKPLPKVAGWIGALISAIPTIYTAYTTGGWKAALIALVSILGTGTAVFAHSATGTGGSPENP